MNATWVVFKKELVDALRDRRALLVVLATTLVSGPVTLLLLSKFVADLKERLEQRQVLVQGADAAPSLVNFMARQGRVAASPPADFRAQMEAGRFDDAVLVLPPSFEGDVRRGVLVELTVFHDGSRAKSATAAALLERLTNGWAQELGLQRLLVRGVDPALLKPARTTSVSIGSARGRSAQLLFLVPLVALIAAVIGALSIAIDVTAGERERGSLEPLLHNPIPLGALALGKWAAVSCVSLATLLGAVASFALAARFIRDEGLAAAFQFGVAEAGLTLLLLAPFCLFIGAALMLVALFSRGHKEAQASTSYLVSLVTFAPSLSLFLSLPDARWQLLVPALGQNMVLARAFRGSVVDGLDVGVPALTCAVLTAGCLAAVVRLLGRERIVFAR